MLVNEVTRDGVLYIDMPVEFDGTRDMTDLVEQHIFVRFDQADVRVVEIARLAVNGFLFLRF